MTTKLLLERSLRSVAHDHVVASEERQLRSFLEQPLKLPPDPATKVRALCEFGLGFGRVAGVGEIVEVPLTTAHMLRNLGRAELCD